MKRNRLLRYLRSQSHITLTERTKHSKAINHENGLMAMIPRHTLLKKALCIAICKQLGVARPPEFS